VSLAERCRVLPIWRALTSSENFISVYYCRCLVASFLVRENSVLAINRPLSGLLEPCTLHRIAARYSFRRSLWRSRSIATRPHIW